MPSRLTQFMLMVRIYFEQYEPHLHTLPGAPCTVFKCQDIISFKYIAPTVLRRITHDFTQTVTYSMCMCVCVCVCVCVWERERERERDWSNRNALQNNKRRLVVIRWWTLSERNTIGVSGHEIGQTEAANTHNGCCMVLEGIVCGSIVIILLMCP